MMGTVGPAAMQRDFVWNSDHRAATIREFPGRSTGHPVADAVTSSHRIHALNQAQRDINAMRAEHPRQREVESAEVNAWEMSPPSPKPSSARHRP